MSYQPVIVMAWVPDDSGNRPDNSLPQPPLGIWGGGNVPFPTPPIYYPEPPLGIWGPNDPRPTPPIYFPPAGGGGAPGVPTHPIYNPPGIWGPTDPRPSQPIYFPEGPPLGIWGGGNVPFPTPPIAPGGPPPQPTHPIYRPDLIPTQPIYNPPPAWPVLDPDSLPDHPEVPDLNAGSWVYVSQGNMLVQAFVPWPLAVTHPDYNPNYPPEENQPGEWVAIYFMDANYNGLTWAWIPSVPTVEHHEATA